MFVYELSLIHPCKKRIRSSFGPAMIVCHLASFHFEDISVVKLQIFKLRFFLAFQFILDDEGHGVL